MKIFKVISSLVFAAAALVSMQASADTQVNCSWQYVSTINGSSPQYGLYSLQTYVCKDSLNRSIANKTVGVTGYVTGVCSLSPISPFTYTGTCQAPTFWEPPVPPKKVCPADGIIRTVSTSSDVNAAMKWTCYLELPECGAVVTASDRSNVTFKCVTK